MNQTPQLTEQQRSAAICAALDRFVEFYGWRYLFECLATVAEVRCSKTAFEASTSAARIFAAHEKRPEQPKPRPQCVLFVRDQALERKAPRFSAR